jgi:GTPase SAR1 family protein
MKKSFKVGFVGAPSSGKTTLSARIFAELLEQGMAGTAYVQEYAREYIGSGEKLNTFFSQEHVTKVQQSREVDAENNNFKIILCDSALWLGSIYLNYRIDNHGFADVEKNVESLSKSMSDYNDLCDTFLKNYDMTIYVPLFSKTSNINDFRIHDSKAAEDIDAIIRAKLKHCSGQVVKAPKQLKNRESFIKYISGEIIDG